MSIQKWTSAQIRQKFLDFFASKGHTVLPSAPMVVKNDPTLMFTNAGMNQFKDIFLGNRPPQQLRVCNSQKCLRVSGKHNDLEEVGVDTYHHTMFEMLGNWSFGDYFKEESIEWAWQLLTSEYQLPVDRLYVTVFGGDPADGLQPDDEAADIWKKNISANRILRFGRKDNFWEMGESGPCGPCSEIHIDLRSDAERKVLEGASLVNAGHPQVIEIWNLVFIQFNRDATGNLHALPSRHVDTGMGLERLVRVLQYKSSNYDSDLFIPVIHKIAALTGKVYQGSDTSQDIAFRVIADHLRAVSFALADGQLPSNTGAGYVIRRILRRAVRYYYSALNCNAPVIFQLIPTIIEILGTQFPELSKQEHFIAGVVREEEENFLHTLGRGLQLIDEEISKNKRISGKSAFALYDTFGFPFDLTQLIAREREIEVDEKGFFEELEHQKERSRKAAGQTTGDWTLLKDLSDSEFVGYDTLTAHTQVIKYRQVRTGNKTVYQLVLHQTPFYPEGGGQVGDSGIIEWDGQHIEIINTIRENNLILHLCSTFPQNIEKKCLASVDVTKRMRAAGNHSATHLLHFALRQVLGTHVEQKGSLVSSDYLRFDFSHFRKMTIEELNEVERLVNDMIGQSIPLQEHRDMAIAEAKAVGAMSLFGEKYGDKVRMIQFGGSRELCGGTHVANTAGIRMFRITSESAIAAGIRRIEAISGDAALKEYQAIQREVQSVRELLGITSSSITHGISALISELNEKNEELERFRLAEVASLKSLIKKSFKPVNGFDVCFLHTSLDDKSLKDVSFQIKSEAENDFVLLLTSDKSGKPFISLMISENLVQSMDMHAGKWIKILAANIQGGGGGQPFYATAGGRQIEGLNRVLMQAEELIIPGK